MPKQRNRYIVLFFLLLAVVSCKQKVRQSGLQGYKKINDSLYYRYEGKGNQQLIQTNHDIYLQRSLCNAFDLQIPCKETFEAYDTITEKNSVHYQWLLSSLTKLHQSDTIVVAMYVSLAKQLLGITPSINLADAEWLYLHLIVTQAKIGLVSKNEKENDKNECSSEDNPVLEKENVSTASASVIQEGPTGSTDEFEKEAYTLRYFLEYTQPELLKYETEPGLFIRITNRGRGRSVKFGDIVSIDYVGRFAMNGKKFDDSSLSPEPFDFVMGKPDQLLKGIEKALYKLKEGGKAEVFFTSRYGYGANGSSTGIVGKYKSLSFVVHLKKIRNK